MKTQTQPQNLVTTIRYQVEHADPGQANWQQIKPILDNEPFARAIANAAQELHQSAGKTQQYRIIKQEHTILPLDTRPGFLLDRAAIQAFTPQEPPKTFTLSARERGEGRGEVPGNVPKKLKRNGTPKQSGGPRPPHTRNLTDGPGLRIRTIVLRLPEPFTSAEVRQMNTDPTIDSTKIAQFLHSWVKNGWLKVSKQVGPAKWYVRTEKMGKPAGQTSAKVLETIRSEIQVPRDPDAGQY